MEGGLATAVSLSNPGGLELSPEGTLLFADHGAGRVFEVGLALAGFAEDEIVIADESGVQLFVFDAAGRHLRTVHSLTGADLLQFRYDDSGLLQEIENGDGLITRIERNAVGEPARIVAPFGQETGLSVDLNGYLASVTNPAEETRTFTYDGLGRLTAWTDALQSETTATYDIFGRLRRETDPDGGFKQLDRSAVDRLTTAVTLTTAEGRTTRYETRRDQFAMRRTVRYPEGRSRTRTTLVGGSSTVTSPDGSQVSATVAPDPRFGMQAAITASQQLSSSGGLSSRSSFERTVSLLDPADPLTVESMQETLVVNGKVSTGHLSMSQRTLVQTTPEGRHSSSSFDDLGRITEVALGSLAPTRFAYDERGLLTSIRRGTGERERLVSLSYDTLGRLAQVTDPLGELTRYAYDEADRLTAIALRDDNVVLDLDGGGRISSVTPPGKPAHRFAYTRTGQLSTYQPPELDLPASASEARYNLDQQLVTLTMSDGDSLVMGYDDAGRPATILLPEGQFAYSYDSETGRISEASSPYGADLAYGYEGFALTRTTWSGVVSGTVDEQPNGDLQVASRSVNTEHTVSFAYDDDGLLVGAGQLSIDRRPDVGLVTGTILGQVTTARSYDEFGELSGVVASFDELQLFGVTYQRDRGGRIARRTETRAGQTFDFEYHYDDGGRLAEVMRNGARIATYTYDANGNRTTETDSSNNTSLAVYDDQDRLLSYGDVFFAYTEHGDLQTKTEDGQTIAYSYDALGNLLSVALPDGLQIEYVHDARGRRVGKKVNGTLVSGLLYKDLLNPIAELDGEGTVVSRFVYGTYFNVPDYMVKGGATYRIVADHLGSPRLIVDVATGAVVQELRYDAFGNVLLDTNPGFQPFGFAGGLYDHQTGLVRFGRRDYDPRVGRWTVKDPILFAGGDTNLYVYVLNDPINLLDPLGTDWIDSSLQGVSDFFAGFGDTLTFGLTGQIRQWMGVDHVVDRCSGLYTSGEIAAVAHSFALGGAAGFRAAGTRGAGREWSHWIPERYDKVVPRWIIDSPLNGRYMSVVQHALNDPYRYRFAPSAWKQANPINPAWLRQWNRAPEWAKGGAAGALYGAAGSATNRKPECGCN